MTWSSAQLGERDWWGRCLNTYGEEEKQLAYARRMGLEFHHDGKGPYNIDLHGASVLDIGGGPCSLLLKTCNAGFRVVADPCHYPDWVAARYVAAGIEYLRTKGEDSLNLAGLDEVWIYNVLQHTDAPALVCANARRAGKIVRIFEWIDTATNREHPHSLTEDALNAWLGGAGQTEILRQPTLRGRCYFGIFKGETY